MMPRKASRQAKEKKGYKAEQKSGGSANASGFVTGARGQLPGLRKNHVQASTSAARNPRVIGARRRSYEIVARDGDERRAMVQTQRPALAIPRRATASEGGLPPRAVAVGCAARSWTKNRAVHEAPNLVGVKEFQLARRLSDALDGLTVFVDRDTAMAAIAEGLAGAARGARDFVYVTVSTGLGGTIVSGGRMLRGASNTAGEIGHCCRLQWTLRRRVAEVDRCGCGSFAVRVVRRGPNMQTRTACRCGRVFLPPTRATLARRRSSRARSERSRISPSAWAPPYPDMIASAAPVADNNQTTYSRRCDADRGREFVSQRRGAGRARCDRSDGAAGLLCSRPGAPHAREVPLGSRHKG